MAKAPNSNVKVPSDFTVTSHGHTLTIDQLAEPASVAYLLGLGFTTALKNKAAMSKESKEKLGSNLDAHVAKARAELFQSIVEGTVSERKVGARVSGIDKFAKDIAMKRLRAIVAKQGKSFPKGDDLALALGRLLKVQGDSIRAEAEAAMAEADAAAEGAEGIL